MPTWWSGHLDPRRQGTGRGIAFSLAVLLMQVVTLWRRKPSSATGRSHRGQERVDGTVMRPVTVLEVGRVLVGGSGIVRALEGGLGMAGPVSCLTTYNHDGKR